MTGLTECEMKMPHAEGKVLSKAINLSCSDGFAVERYGITAVESIRG